MKKAIKYEEAVKELEEIVRQMESDRLDIDVMSDKLKIAQELITICKSKLKKTDEEIRKILDKE